MPVRTSVEQAVATLTLDRPEARNALSAALCDELTSALEEIARRDDVRVVLVRGEGRVFCAGADLSAVSGPDGLGFLPSFERMLETVAAFPLPTIAVIQGAALGGGLQLATVCDFRLVGEGAKLGIPSTRLGIVVNFENVQRLALLTGLPAAREILMTGRIFSGVEAAERGWVTSAVDDAGLSRAAEDLALRIARLAPLSVRGAKAALRVVEANLGDARSASPQQASAIDELVAEAYRSEDLAEGVAAAGEKRAPNFRGR